MEQDSFDLPEVHILRSEYWITFIVYLDLGLVHLNFIYEKNYHKNIFHCFCTHRSLK